VILLSDLRQSVGETGSQVFFLFDSGIIPAPESINWFRSKPSGDYIPLGGFVFQNRAGTAALSGRTTAGPARFDPQGIENVPCDDLSPAQERDARSLIEFKSRIQRPLSGGLFLLAAMNGLLARPAHAPLPSGTRVWI
jgi:hypothetical protein